MIYDNQANPSVLVSFFFANNVKLQECTATIKPLPVAVYTNLHDTKVRANFRITLYNPQIRAQTKINTYRMNGKYPVHKLNTKINIYNPNIPHDEITLVNKLSNNIHLFTKNIFNQSNEYIGCNNQNNVVDIYNCNIKTNQINKINKIDISSNVFLSNIKCDFKETLNLLQNDVIVYKPDWKFIQKINDISVVAYNVNVFSQKNIIGQCNKLHAQVRLIPDGAYFFVKYWINECQINLHQPNIFNQTNIVGDCNNLNNNIELYHPEIYSDVIYKSLVINNRIDLKDIDVIVDGGWEQPFDIWFGTEQYNINIIEGYGYTNHINKLNVGVKHKVVTTFVQHNMRNLCLDLKNYGTLWNCFIKSDSIMTPTMLNAFMHVNDYGVNIPRKIIQQYLTLTQQYNIMMNFDQTTDDSIPTQIRRERLFATLSKR